MKHHWIVLPIVVTAVSGVALSGNLRARPPIPRSIWFGPIAPTTLADKQPYWVREQTPIKPGDIPASDYPYLANWLDRHARPARDYVIDLFKRHQVVICGEIHNVREHKTFIINLIGDLYHKAGVRCIAWEFSRQSDNPRLEEFVMADRYDPNAVLDFARRQMSHEWNSKEHWEIIEAVWRFNQSLKPGQERLRLIGIFPDIDLCEVEVVLNTKPPDSPEFRKTVLPLVQALDRSYAQPVKDEILDKGIKGLVFVGRCHDFTHYQFPPEVNRGRAIMGHVLHEQYGERVFQVWLGHGWLEPIPGVMALREHVRIGFDLYASPFANVLSPPNWDAPEVPLHRIARGYVYLGPRSSLHKNTPIKGFITEKMFKQHKRYYELSFKRSFKNAGQLDLYLQKHRFPNP